MYAFSGLFVIHNVKTIDILRRYTFNSSMQAEITNTNRMTYREVQQWEQTTAEDLFKSCHVFWAFSDNQFREGADKNPLTKGEKYISIGAGGYMPKHHYQTLIDRMASIKEQRMIRMRQVKAEQAIAYELSNHECEVTHNLEPVISLFEGVYTPTEIREVFATTISTSKRVMA